MAKVAVRYMKRIPDLSLIDFLWDACGNTDWRAEKSPTRGGSFRTSLIGGRLLFAIKLGTGKLVAAIYEGDPFKIVLFDESALGDIKKMLKKFKSEAVVLIEIQ